MALEGPKRLISGELALDVDGRHPSIGKKEVLTLRVGKAKAPDVVRAACVAAWVFSEDRFGAYVDVATGAIAGKYLAVLARQGAARWKLERLVVRPGGARGREASRAWFFAAAGLVLPSFYRIEANLVNGSAVFGTIHDCTTLTKLREVIEAIVAYQWLLVRSEEGEAKIRVIEGGATTKEIELAPYLRFDDGSGARTFQQIVDARQAKLRPTKSAKKGRRPHAQPNPDDLDGVIDGYEDALLVLEWDRLAPEIPRLKKPLLTKTPLLLAGEAGLGACDRVGSFDA